MLVSQSMRQSETPVVYAMTFGDSPHYTISTSQSQGFAWNQDIFASQYQQMCKVVYDGHEDCVDELLARDWRFSDAQNAYTPSDVFEQDEDQDMTSHDELRARRMSQVLMRPRRRSERSVSFVSDSKNGRFQKTEVILVDVDEDTEENRRLRWLVNKE
ncbi:LAME_0B07272g1_1 [Lachancea meyersii CBS 8951]|uniref:LAME_0B07272g1_1 n=1 Tax=Lachancea meyersii CBS 8951 TaxID=1266667 RepID=A0A1G4IX06_9SACH|nr:LAME_0B07272g1_1 [Lachancea meyersii CBS 8951]